MYCITYASYSNLVKVLAQDHFNDIILQTTGVSLGLVAHYTSVWYLDPIAAILIAFLIFRCWVITGKDHIKMLVGLRYY
jgi:divalent metal cation (Fe/Co/Zn/Cd) transporter